MGSATISKARAARCTTHFHACDCREYRYEQMEQALKIISIWALHDSLDAKQTERLAMRALGMEESQGR